MAALHVMLCLIEKPNKNSNKAQRCQWASEGSHRVGVSSVWAVLAQVSLGHVLLRWVTVSLCIHLTLTV